MAACDAWNVWIFETEYLMFVLTIDWVFLSLVLQYSQKYSKK